MPNILAWGWAEMHVFFPSVVFPHGRDKDTELIPRDRIWDWVPHLPTLCYSKGLTISTELLAENSFLLGKQTGPRPMPASPLPTFTVVSISLQ